MRFPGSIQMAARRGDEWTKKVAVKKGFTTETRRKDFTQRRKRGAQRAQR
jgi:hypothetical protein